MSISMRIKNISSLYTIDLKKNSIQAYKLLLMFGKNAKKAKLLNDYVKIAPKKTIVRIFVKKLQQT